MESLTLNILTIYFSVHEIFFAITFSLGFGLIHLCPCRRDNGYIDGQSQIKVHTNERTQVHSAQALSLPWWSPMQVLTEVDVP